MINYNGRPWQDFEGHTIVNSFMNEGKKKIYIEKEPCPTFSHKSQGGRQPNFIHPCLLVMSFSCLRAFFSIWIF